MKFTQFLTKQYLISLSVLVLLALLILPFPTESVPEWKVLVIDKNYLPGGNMEVEQRVEHIYFGDISVYKATTDKNGFITFPERHLWASVASRFMSVLAGLFGKDTETYARITATKDRCPGGIISWQSGDNEEKPLPDKLVCP